MLACLLCIGGDNLRDLSVEILRWNSVFLDNKENSNRFIFDGIPYIRTCGRVRLS